MVVANPSCRCQKERSGSLINRSPPEKGTTTVAGLVTVSRDPPHRRKVIRAGFFIANGIVGQGGRPSFTARREMRKREGKKMREKMGRWDLASCYIEE